MVLEEILDSGALLHKDNHQNAAHDVGDKENSDVNSQVMGVEEQLDAH